VRNAWAGVLIHGCVRDSDELAADSSASPVSPCVPASTFMPTPMASSSPNIGCSKPPTFSFRLSIRLSAMAITGPPDSRRRRRHWCSNRCSARLL
jgi:hypothetical protein